MRCFHYFKDKTKSRVQRSAPELKSQSKYSATTDGDDDSRRIAKSSCSTATTSTRGVSELYEEKAQNLRVFRLSELKRATHSFSRLLKIGEGGFGIVYKGSIKLTDGDGYGEDDFVPVAIKKLSSTALQGHKQWLAEVQFLGIVEHENLVKLIGYCAVDGERGIQRLLVYEYMPNRSLEDHLFNNSKPPLCWDTRLKIILGAAQGLAYLHEGLEVQVIFRDFKTSNVLLDEKFKPKLSDFGLAREGPMDGNTHVSTAVVGTYGYAAPDYVETGRLTAKSDVWSFGVVLYEILTGRRSLERNLPRAEQKLLEWVKEFPPESKRFDQIMDQRLQDRYSFSGARRVARLANRCLAKSARDRPSMSQVVAELQEIVGNTEDGNPRALAASEDGSCPDADRKSEADLDQVGPTESWKRRMAHLAKLGDGVEVAGRRRFMIAQRAQVN